MRFTQSWLAVAALVFSVALPVKSLAGPSVEDRISRLESLLANKVTLETLNEIETLKTEVQHLHGKLEEQQHAIAMLTQKQEKLFLDLDQRINQLPAKTTTGMPGSSAGYKFPNYPPPAANKPVSAPNIGNIENKPSAVVPPPPVNNSNVVTNPRPAASSSANEQNLYNAAYKLVDDKNYKAAQVAFQDFLWQFPDGQFAANAHYWLGEIYLSEWHNNKIDKDNLDKAISSFQAVITKYAKHHKAADSLLKLGIIASEQNNMVAAREYFTKLKQQYPGSSRAQMAEMRLQRLAQ